MTPTRTPFAWRPLYLIGAASVTILTIFSCGVVLFAMSADSSDEPTTEFDPDLAERYMARALSSADRGNFEEALDDFTRAIDLNPTSAQGYYNRGITYINLGAYQKAVDDFTEAVELRPEHTDAYTNRALSYALLGLESEAGADLERAVELGADRELLVQVINEALNAQ